MEQKLAESDLTSPKESQIYAYLDSRLDSYTKKGEAFEGRIEDLIIKQNAEITAELRRLEQDISKKDGQSQDTAQVKSEIEQIEKAVNDWTKNVEDQLNV